MQTASLCIALGVLDKLAVECATFLVSNVALYTAMEEANALRRL